MRNVTPSSMLVRAVFAVAALAGGCHSGVVSMRSRNDAAIALDAGGPSAAEVFGADVGPLLDRRCAGCHGPSRSAPDFLRPNPDVRSQVLGYPLLVDLADPTNSRLLTKGPHAGPALDATEARGVEAWIAMEAAEGTIAAPVERDLSTDRIAIREGFNALSLDRLGLRGAGLHFVATRVAGGMFLDGMAVAAGPDGAVLEHPVLVTWIDGEPTSDPVDRFAGLELRVEPGRDQPFDTGVVSLTSFPEGAEFSLRFDDVRPLVEAPVEVDGGTAMPTGTPATGCTQLDAFRAMAAPALDASCTGCHGGGNPSATGAVDMRRVAATDDASLTLGCNQILGRIPSAAPDASGLFVQTMRGGPGSHPFRFPSDAAGDAFRAAILGWHAMEVGR